MDEFRRRTQLLRTTGGPAIHAVNSAWAAGKDEKTTRDIIQLALLGPGPAYGTGVIPADCIIGTTPKAGVPE